MRTPKIVTVIAIEGLILEKLYIPDGDGDATTGKSSDEASKTFIYDLVDESLKLTGNLDEEEIGRFPIGKKPARLRRSGGEKMNVRPFIDLIDNLHSRYKQTF